MSASSLTSTEVRLSHDSHSSRYRWSHRGGLTCRQPIRIALVSDAVHPFHRGGKELRYYEIGRRLAAHPDVHLAVYTMRWWGRPKEQIVDGVRYIGISPYRPLYSGRRRSILQAIVFAVGCLRLLTYDYDVIQADHMPYMQLLPLWLVSRLRRCRLVVTWHEVWGPSYWKCYLGPLGLIGWALERAAMALPDQIISASEETATRLQRYRRPARPITVAPNGVDLRLAHGVAPADDWEGDLVTVGRMLPHKRFDLVLEAVAALRAAGVERKCLLIGGGPELDALRARAEALGVADLVQFDTNVETPSRLYSLLKAAKVFVLPSEREGFGIAVLEALACGLPVVTTSTPDNLARHLVAKDAKSVECAHTVEGLAEAIEAVMHDTRGLDRNGLWIEPYDWESVTEAVLAASYVN